MTKSKHKKSSRAETNQLVPGPLEAIKRLSIIKNAPFSLLKKDYINKIEHILKLQFSLLSESQRRSFIQSSKMAHMYKILRLYLTYLKNKTRKRREKIAHQINEEEEQAEQARLKSFKEHLDGLTKVEIYNINTIYYDNYFYYLTEEINLAELSLPLIYGLSPAYLYDLELMLKSFKQDATPEAFASLPRGLQLLTGGYAYDHDGEKIDGRRTMRKHFRHLEHHAAGHAARIAKEAMKLAPEPKVEADGKIDEPVLEEKIFNHLAATQLITVDDPQPNNDLSDEERMRRNAEEIVRNPGVLRGFLSVVTAINKFKKAGQQAEARCDALLKSQPDALKDTPQAVIPSDEQPTSRKDYKTPRPPGH